MGDNNMWVDTQRIPNTLYKDNPLSKLDGIAAAKETYFKNAGINSLGD